MILHSLLVLVVALRCCGQVWAEEAPESPNWSPERGAESAGSFMTDMWLEGADTVKILWRDCSRKLTDQKDNSHEASYALLVGCIKRKTLKALDRSLSSDVIPVGRGVSLYRYEQVNKKGKVTGPVELLADVNSTKALLTEEMIEKGEWRHLVLQRMAKVLSTHVLKVDMSSDDGKPEIAEFRHRRRHQMMNMMMFGIVSMGMVLVPMGFQFLAVLGGKALLLAKLALILSSIQGLKKVATSPLNYGLYATYPSVASSYSNYDAAFEKRNYNGPPPPPPPTHPAYHQTDPAPVAYRFNSDSMLWKPDAPKIKKSPFNLLKGDSVYPVYGVYPQEGSRAAGGPDPAEDRESQPALADVRAEYTIDLPLGHLQEEATSEILHNLHGILDQPMKTFPRVIRWINMIRRVERLKERLSTIQKLAVDTET